MMERTLCPMSGLYRLLIEINSGRRKRAETVWGSAQFTVCKAAVYISILMLNTVVWMDLLLVALVFLEAGIHGKGFHNDFHLHTGPKSCSQPNSPLIADPY